MFESDNVLRKLDASGNDLTDLDVISMFNALCGNYTLRELNLRSNNLKDQSAEFVSKMLSENATHFDVLHQPSVAGHFVLPVKISMKRLILSNHKPASAFKIFKQFLRFTHHRI